MVFVFSKKKNKINLPNYYKKKEKNNNPKKENASKNVKRVKRLMTKTWPDVKLQLIIKKFYFATF